MMLRRAAGCVRGLATTTALPYRLKNDVAAALAARQPVVAIESSSIALGLPYPDNKQLAMEIAQNIKNKGAVPALIGISDHVVHVGMSEHDIDKLVAEKPYKATARNIGYAVHKGLRATSTVSAALVIADLLGIGVVVTSSIGGVQQGGHESMDISSDLFALSRSSTAVVCSGVSPVLDIPRTLEFLDTHEVTTLTLGETDDFPALMCRTSGSHTSGYMATPQDFAAMLRAKIALGGRGGTVIAVPAPEHLAIPNDVYQSAVSQAEMEASYEDMHGEQLADYIYTRVDEITDHSLSRAIKGLLLHNASVAAEVAVSLSKLQSQTEQL